MTGLRKNKNEKRNCTVVPCEMLIGKITVLYSVSVLTAVVSLADTDPDFSTITVPSPYPCPKSGFT